MATHEPRSRRSGLLPLTCALAISAAGCGRDPVTAPVSRPVVPSVFAAKSSTALAVSSTSPPFGDQGTTIDVHVFGGGFSSGAKVTWLLNGLADDHVHTNSTTFVSSSELIANVTIASDAQLAFWDVQVSLSNGKNGVGSDLFEVTSAQILGPGTTGGDVTVRAINELHQVVGWSDGPSGSTAWVYDDALGLVALGPGSSRGIDPLGTLVVGNDSDSRPSAWIRQPDNSWMPQVLPLLDGAFGGVSMAAARLDDGTLLAVGWNSFVGAKPHSSATTAPVSWTLVNGTWSAPQMFAMPPGGINGQVRDVNHLGQAVGQVSGVAQGIVWDSPTSYALLDGTPNRINASGTLIVGVQNSVGVYWWRDRQTGAWHTTGVPLPSAIGTMCSFGRGVNDAGLIVGWSCNQTHHLATVWQLDLSGSEPVLVSATFLSGLGKSTTNAEEVSSGAEITETAPYVVAGSATLGGTRLAVRWRLP
jgi:hypothetical protein